MIKCLLFLFSIQAVSACSSDGVANKQIEATKGYIQGQFIPAVDNGDISYIWIPWYNNKIDVESFVEFEVEACADTDITFSAKVLAPTNNDDSVFLQMDDEQRVPWQLRGATTQWTWKTLETPFKLTAGKHKLRVLHREDGTKIAELKIESGDANICGECGCGTDMVDSDGDFTYDCNDECKTDPLKRSPQLCGCGQVDEVDVRYEQVRLGQTENLKPGAPYPLGAPGDITCGGNAKKSKCQFPFDYNGTTYHTCTSDGHSQDWCVAGTGSSTGLQFGNCDCPERHICAASINGVANRIGNFYWSIEDVVDDAAAEAKCTSECFRKENCGYAMMTLPFHADSPAGDYATKYNCRLYTSCNETRTWWHPVRNFVITRDKCPLRIPEIFVPGASCTHGRPPLIPLSGEKLDERIGLKACTHECDKSSQCAPGLECFQRQNGEPIPGCNGTAQRTWDFCYDPRELSRDLDLGSAKMTATECMRTVRRHPLCDNTYFNLAADGKCSCVGPTTDCNDKKNLINGDGTVFKIVTDLCPSTAKNAPGVCGCDKPESGDSDGDGVLDCVDECPNDRNKSRKGLCGCGNTDQVRHEWTQLDLGHPKDTCSILEQIRTSRSFSDAKACKQACVDDPRCFYIYWQSAQDLQRSPDEKDNTFCQMFQSCALPPRSSGSGKNFGLKRTNCAGPIQATTRPPLVPHSPGPCTAAAAGLPGHKQPDGFPKMLSEGTHELDASTNHLLLVLKKLNPSLCSAQAVARSYDAYEWEGVMPVPWDGLQTDCKAKTCIVTVPAGVQYRIDAFAQTENPTADESASRFLSQTSFGAMRKDIKSFLKSFNADSVIRPTDNTLFKAWLDDQTSLPATLMRKYWRERTNQRVAVDSQAGSTIQPCEKMSRWHRYAWTNLDKLKELKVVSNPTLKLYQFYMDGVLRTESRFFLKGSSGFVAWDGTAPSTATYILCTVKEYVNGKLKLRVGRGPDAHKGTGCNLEARNSLIHFSKPDTQATQVFETSSSAHLQPIRGTKDSSWEYTRFKGQQVFVMQNTPGADCAIKRSGGVSFAGFKDDMGTCAPVTFGTTKTSLEQAGWSLKFTHTDRSDTTLAKKCDEDAVNKGWWGRSVGKEYPQGEGNNEVGVASFTMKGKGTAQLHFGNCGTGGEVNVYINKKLVTQASSNEEYIFTFDFVHGDLLELKDEEGNAVVKIISLKITCASVTYYRWDPRLRLLDNTLAEPAQIPSDTESSCPNVPRTFLNRDSCQRRNSGTCARPVFQRGKMLTLDEATIKAFYSEGNRHVHRIADLRLEDDYAKSPCLEGTVSRWTKVTGSCTSNLDSATLSAMASAIRTSSDTNQNIKDVIVTNSVPLKDFRTINQGQTCLDSNAREADINECKRYASETDGLDFETASVSFKEASGCIIFQSKVYFQPNDEPNQKCFKDAKCVCVSGICSTSRNSIGAKVNVDGTCWQHVHPLHNSVIDFSYWTIKHDGNEDVEALGSPNPIARWAHAGLVDLNFPRSHPMDRWKQRFPYFDGVAGRFGDKIDFADLPVNLQTKKLADYFGVSSSTGLGAFEACGSPGEVSNVKTLGHRYLFPTEEANEFDWAPLRDHHDPIDGKLMVWANVVMKAKDQLRQRMAWALSQIFVVSESGADGQEEDIEPWVSYYDIFVDNAFGNYFDVMKQVSKHPLMSIFLTFMDNKAYQYTKTYPDENYAREIMQLFSIGLIKMNRDGTPLKDSNGYLVATYDNDNITPFARLWTGYSRQATRANTEAKSGSNTRNLIDPLQMKYQWRDRFPKASLDNTYLGDTYYPLCSELPPRPFLAPGARFEYTGEHSLEGPLFDADDFAPQNMHKFETLGRTTKICSGKQISPGSGSRDFVSCRNYCFLNDGVSIRKGDVSKNCTHLFWASAEDRKDLDGRPMCMLYDDEACTGSNDMQKNMKNLWTHSKIVREKCGGDGKSCTRGRFQPTAASSLYKKLCAKGNDGKCTFPIEVRLDTRLPCEGKQECEADMIRVVKMVDTAANKIAYYTFIPPNCVRQQFFEGRVIKYDGNTQSQCANPDVAGIAATVCCDKDMYPLFNKGDECLFNGESMKYKTAQERCVSLYKDVGGQLCTHHDIQDEFNVAQCGPNQHAWTSTPCKAQVNVHPDGTINIYGRGRSTELSLLSGNNFQVHWEHLEGSSYNYPIIGTQADKSKADGSCDGIYHANAEETRVFLMNKRTQENDAVAYSQSGAWIEWDVVACTAGSHTINIEYALQGFRDTKIFVNGGQANMVAYQPTNSWAVFTKSHDMIFELKEGNNTIKLESHGFGMPNIRALHVSSVVDNACTAKGCVAIKVAGGSCLCDVEVENKAVYTSTTKPPTREELLRTLLIGAAHPQDFDGEYTKCTLSGCNARSGVTVWTKSKTGSPVALDSDTIFVLINDQPWQRPGIGKSVSLLNRASTVHIGGGAKSGNGFSFRNPGNFMPNVGEMYMGRSGWTEDFRVPNAEAETEALLNHLFWHPNVAPYVAKQLIQRFTESNPSPRYVEAVSMAFINGAYGSQKFSNRYGDLKAALYATLLDREARSSVLLADPHYGKMNEPLLEVLRVMRSLEYETVDDQEIPLANQLEHKVGMAAFRSETVFNFYQPDYAPPGPVAKALLVAPETQIMTAPQLISMATGLHSLFYGGLTSCLDGFGRRYDKSCKTMTEIQRTTDGTLTYVPTEPENPKAVVRELAMLLTDGRLNDVARTVIEKAYARVKDLLGREHALKAALKLLVLTAEFHSNNLNLFTGKKRPEPVDTPSQGRAFKAVVVIYLGGGADMYNLLVPKSGCGVDGVDKEYATVRGVVGLDQQSLHSITVESDSPKQPCDTFGIHKSFPLLKELYDKKECSFVANVGGLIEPMTKAQYKDRTVPRPRSLFSHNFMTKYAMNVHTDNQDADGILARLVAASSKAPNNFKSAVYSIAGRSKMVKGELVESIVSDTSGIARLPKLDTIKDDVAKLNEHSSESIFSETYASNLEYSLKWSEDLGVKLDQTTINTTFNTDSEMGGGKLARQLNQVAKLIKLDVNTLKTERATYLTSLNGWDGHGATHMATLETKFAQMNSAISDFVKEMKSQKLWENVVLVTSSDFGRTITPNSAGGTDHAWGNHHFVCGGSVQGGRVQGKYPDSLLEGSELDVGRGRIIPEFSWESMWHPVASWFGIDNEQMSYVLPNWKRFESKLIPQAQMFDVKDGSKDEDNAGGDVVPTTKKGSGFESVLTTKQDAGDEVVLTTNQQDEGDETVLTTQPVAKIEQTTQPGSTGPSQTPSIVSIDAVSRAHVWGGALGIILMMF